MKYKCNKDIYIQGCSDIKIYTTRHICFSQGSIYELNSYGEPFFIDDQNHIHYVEEDFINEYFTLYAE